MTLLTFKWIAAFIVFSITLLAGLLSAGFARRFQKQLEIGDAIANGIFIGAAIFHLLPDAITGFEALSISVVYLRTALLLVSSYCIFWLIEKILVRKQAVSRHQVHVGILVVILSIHAFIAGLTLGISDTFSLVSILFAAIIAHKGFETFAFIINIYRRVKNRFHLFLLLLIFSVITPAGIILGLLSNFLLESHVDDLLTACFSAIAAGTFLYIGTTHSHHVHQHEDSHHQYSRIIATIVGVVLMAILGIWI